MQSTYALEIAGLNHRYGKHAVLHDINLALPPGKIYGLLGRNGAGKTTLLNILSTSMSPTSGKMRIFGQAPFERAEALSRLCYVREKSMVPPGCRLRDALLGCSKIYPHWDHDYALEMARKFDLNLGKKFKQLSRGMESSLGLVIGLASRAELTVFDEPSLGLDAAAREHFYDELMRDIREYRRTVIVSTHLIDEVTRLFDDVIIIDRGRIQRIEPIESLLSQYITYIGPRQAVEQGARGLKVLSIEELGDTVRFLAEWDGREQPPGVRQEPVALQRLFVYLTEGGDRP